MFNLHKFMETRSVFLLIGILVAVAIGGLVEIVPLFYLGSTIEKVEGMRPYSPLELAGRNIYVREGCYNCHSQMVRSLRDEVERYGPYSLAAESMYDHPFQWGSKRTGPDLARVGGKYSDEWHVAHLPVRKPISRPRRNRKATAPPPSPPAIPRLSFATSTAIPQWFRKWMRWLRICRCSARWSTSACMTQPGRTSVREMKT